jgi:hydrogenase expression/formation protein HypE
MEDSAVLDVPEGRLAFTTDSFIVKPIFFPGGDIGRLAVCGTVNDLAMAGAEPRWLSLSLILEEGLEFEALDRVLDSIASAAGEAGVQVVTGDTKVVERGACDRVFINTAGVGVIPAGRNLDSTSIKPGDRVLLSGTIAEHGLAVLLAREELEIRTPLKSDAACLNGLAGCILDAAPGTRAMRDPTRGGVAAALCDFAEASGVGLEIDESQVPLTDAARGACEIGGFDPLVVANEGKLIAVVPPEEADIALDAAVSHPLGANARIIGEITDRPPGKVILRTMIGGRRFVEKPYGEQLPRIC